MGKTFATSDITEMAVVETSVTNNAVSIEYNGETATVTVAGNVAQYVTPTVNGAHVTIIQSNTDAVDGDESSEVTDQSILIQCNKFFCGLHMLSLLSVYYLILL